MKQFVLDIIKDVETTGLKIELVDEEYVYCYPNDTSLESRTSGWFDETDSRCALQIAVGRPEKEWHETLIHEYSHFLQWKEGETFNRYDKAMVALEGWTQYCIELEEEELWKSIQAIRDIELDAEKRTVDMMRKWDLYSEKEIEEYIQKANAYALTYNVIAIARHWPDNPAYRTEAVYSQMPTEFLKDYNLAHVPYVKLFYKYCLKIKATGENTDGQES